jgi:hypothetical protein
MDYFENYYLATTKGSRPKQGGSLALKLGILFVCLFVCLF